MSTHTPASHGDPVQQLGFRVMRLCKPSLHVDAPLRLNLGEDMEADGGRVAGVDEAEALACAPFASRVQLGDSLDAAGLTGMMELPQSFGTIYLGEVNEQKRTPCPPVSIDHEGAARKLPQSKLPLTSDTR